MENVYILGLVSVFIIIIIVMIFIFKSLLTKSKNEKEILIEKLSKSEKNIDHQVQVKLEEITYSLRNQINDLKQPIERFKSINQKIDEDKVIKLIEKATELYTGQVGNFIKVAKNVQQIS